MLEYDFYVCKIFSNKKNSMWIQPILGSDNYKHAFELSELMGRVDQAENDSDDQSGDQSIYDHVCYYVLPVEVLRAFYGDKLPQIELTQKK